MIKNKHFGVNYLAKFVMELDRIWCSVETCCLMNTKAIVLDCIA